MVNYSVVNLEDIDIKDRIDAEYFQPDFLRIAKSLSNSPPLQRITKLITSAFYPAATQLYSIGDVPFIRCVDVVDFPVVSSLQNSKFERLPKYFIDENKTIKKLIGGDIVITKVGTPCYASVIDESLKEVALSRTVLGLIDIKIDPYYVVAFLRSRYGFLQLMRECELTIQLQLTLKRVGRIKVFIPSDEKIKEISSMMREYFKLLKESHRLYETALKLFSEELNLTSLNNKNYEHSYLIDYSDVRGAHRIDAEYFHPKYTTVLKKLEEVARKHNWEIKKVAEISKSLKYGTSEKLQYLEEGIPFLRITDIQNLDFDLDSLCHIAEQEAKKIGNAKVKKGDVVISRSGTLGLAVPIGKELENAIFGSYFIRIRPKIEINSIYLAFYLNSILGKSQVERFSTGAIQTNLTIPAIENIRVLIPKKDFQEKISNLIQASKISRQKGKKLLKEAVTKVESEIETTTTD